jgi:hypothetical protein
MFAGHWWTNILVAHSTVSWSVLKLKMNPLASVKKTSCSLAVSSHRTWDTCSLGSDLLVITTDAYIIFTIVAQNSFNAWRALYWLLTDGEKVRSDLLIFGVGIALPLYDIYTGFCVVFLETEVLVTLGWVCLSDIYRSQHPVLSNDCYSAVCTWESVSCDFL